MLGYILGYEEIKSIVNGAVNIGYNDGRFEFHRLTETQENRYADKEAFFAKARASANVRFAFNTNSKTLSFDYRTYAGSSREFAYFDLYINGALTRHFGMEGFEMTSGHTVLSLGEGEKQVELYLPWSRRVDISNFELDYGAELAAVKRHKTMLCFGDSITQGFDNLYPSLSYVSRLARMLGADEINKGIGGDKFRVDILEDEGLSPDIITVAYGTNDWMKISKEDFVQGAKEFYKRASELYPNSHIFAISPIWRVDEHKNEDFALAEVYGAIVESCRGLENIYPINAYPFVPHTKEFFKDMRVHPSDLGSASYAEGLYSEIIKHLQNGD